VRQVGCLLELYQDARSPEYKIWQDTVWKMCCAITDVGSCTFKERVHAERTTFFSVTG